MSDRGKQILFSLDEFIIMMAWLGAMFAILYFKAYEFIIPSIVAFVVLNLAIGLWIRHVSYPIEKKSYRQYLTIQTLFLAIWCPLLFIIITAERTDLISVWIAILLVFYFGIGILSGREALKSKKKKKKKRK